MKRILVRITIIILILSCSRTIDCIDPPIYISFISFPPNTLNNIVIKKFDKGSNFQNLIDTLQVTNTNGSIINRGDTSVLSLGNPNNYPQPGFDWQIFIPAINRTVSITDINKRDKTGKCAAMQSNCFCNDEILNLKIDNQTGVLKTNHGSFNLFIR